MTAHFKARNSSLWAGYFASLLVNPLLAKAIALIYPSWSWYNAAPSPVVLASVCRMYGSLELEQFANPKTGAVVSLAMSSNALWHSEVRLSLNKSFGWMYWLLFVFPLPLCFPEKPRKDRSSFRLLGTGQVFRALIFSESVCTPYWDKMWQDTWLMSEKIYTFLEMVLVHTSSVASEPAVVSTHAPRGYLRRLWGRQWKPRHLSGWGLPYISP